VIQLAAWLLVCLGVAWLLRRRPVAVASVAIAGWTLVPAIAGYRFTGVASGPLGAHPATYLVLSGLLMQVLTNPRAVAAALARHPLVLLVVTVFSLGAAGTSAVMSSGGSRLLLDQIVGPFVLWLLVVIGATDDPPRLIGLRNVIVGAAVVQSLIAVAQLRADSILFYERDYDRLPWFDPETYSRWMGTADSPLVFAMLLCVAGGLSLSLRSSMLRVPLLMLFLVGTLIAQARAGTAALCLILVYSVLRPSMALWVRALTTAVFGATAYVVVSSGLVSGLADRIANDSGSGAARLRALQFVTETAGSYIATGHGLTASYDVARNAGLRTSLESSFLMYVVDVGLILATLYFGLELVLLLRYGRHGYLRGATVAALAAVGLQHIFSAVAGANLSGALIWAALAIVVAGSLEPRPTPGARFDQRAPAGGEPERARFSSVRARDSVSTSPGS
jgi:hypothetical protein